MAAIDTGAVPAQGAGARARALLRAAFAVGEARAVAAPDRIARSGLLIWAPVFLALGIGGWFALRIEPGPRAYAAAALAGAAALAAAARARHAGMAGRMDWDRADLLRMIAHGAALAALGFLCAGARAYQVAGPVLDFRYYGPIEGRVVDIDRSARDRMRLTLDQVVMRDTPAARTPRRVRLSLTEAQNLPPPGTRVMLTGHLGPNPGPAEPDGFDFRQAAFFAQLGAVGYTRNPIVVLSSAPPRLLDATELRLKLGAGMRRAIGGQEGAVAAALMTGDRSGIAEATNQTMRDSNLYHIVSISGLHMSMLAGFVYGALRLALAGAQATPWGRRFAGWPVHKGAALGALAAATAYLLLSGGGVPTNRSYLMVAVMLGAILIDRRAMSLRTVAVAATAILITAPDALVTPGFQMSFAATAALIMLFPSWSRHAGRLPWIIRGAAMLILSSLIAGIATSPIAAAHFNRSAQYGLIANLLVVPVMGAVVMPAGVIAALLAPIGLAGPALWAMGIGTRWMLYVGATVAGWGGAVVAVPAPHWTVLPLGGTGAVIALLIQHAPVRRGLARCVAAAGVAAVIAAAGIWLTGERPALLISADGGAAGLMTPAGRALSKPAGAFVADSWLRADGDTASADGSAARPGWQGGKGVRTAQLAGAPLVHLTGKAAAGRLADACRGGGIVVMQGRAPAGEAGPCLVLDEGALASGGARAAWVRDGQLRWLTAADASGERLWTSARVRRAWGLGAGGQRWADGPGRRAGGRADTKRTGPGKGGASAGGKRRPPRPDAEDLPQAAAAGEAVPLPQGAAGHAAAEPQATGAEPALLPQMR